MAIITNGGHAQRALDFYDKTGKYFIIGGTTPWETESTPPSPESSVFTLEGIIALKSVDNYYIVKKDPSGSISYNNENWKIVPPRIDTTLRLSISQGDTEISLNSISGLTEGSKLRIHELYEGKIVSINSITRVVQLDTPAPADISLGSTVKAGAVIEGAHHVYLESILEFDTFPLVTYRQAGLCVGVTPSTENIMRAAAYSESGSDEYTSIGTLEVLDNKPPVIRNTSMSERLCVMLEF